MRAILIVLDSVGIGELPDAAKYGDEGSNTLLNIKRVVPEMDLKNMNMAGLSSIDGADILADYEVKKPTGAFCKLAEVSEGKDTTIGHWEISGLITEKAFPTYPKGFPQDLIDKFEKKTGRKVIGNCVASGTEIIKQLGDEHVKTGDLIVYTSADSVFQVAAHEEVIDIEEQYKICEMAREMLTSPHNVSRVIARPFVGASGEYVRTKNRKDFSLEPMHDTMLDYIKSAGLTVAGVGKIYDIFAGRGITESVHTASNNDGVDKTLEYMLTVKDGLIFTNLVDFDMLYGHRNDPKGYASARIEFDRRLPEIIARLRSDDILFITADHGCDPVTESTDHSREYVPLLIIGERIKPALNLGTRDSFADISATIMEYLNVTGNLKGKSFLKEIFI